MTERQIQISYQEYNSIEEMNPEDRELAAEAIKAMQGAYAPYSHFHVGAAVRMSNGQIVRGANQENAAFPSGLCAERTAMFAAGARYPDKDMLSIALAGGVMGRLGREPATPCGAFPLQAQRAAAAENRRRKRFMIRGIQKRESLAHRTATTSCPCCLPALGEFRGSWSCTTFPPQI